MLNHESLKEIEGEKEEFIHLRIGAFLLADARVARRAGGE